MLNNFGINMNLANRILNCFKNRKNFDSEKNYRTLLQTIQDGVFVIQDSKFVYVNDAFIEITEKPYPELVGSPFLSIDIHPEDVDTLKFNYVGRLNGESVPSEYPVRIYTPSGKLKYICMTVGLGMYKGKVASMGTVSDISKQHIIDSKLNTLKNAVKNTPNGILITDKHGEIEYINPAFTEMTGYTIAEVLGKTPRILKSGHHNEDFYESMWATLLSGNVWKSELRNKRKDGTVYWEKQSISPIKNDAGEITHFVGIKEDITGWKKLKDNLVKAKDKAEESDNLKTAFLASMSHEIRTPMNAIIGFTDLLRDESMHVDKREKYQDHITNAGDTLLNLIDDIIDIAKIEAGQMKITESTCDLSDLMDGLMKIHTEQKNKSGKERIDLIPNGDNVKEQLIIKTDCHRLNQILNNIIGNALKFTDEGYVKFGYLTVSDELLQFYVKDTGIGIPDDEMENIFDRFRRVENDEKIYQGTGLGLAITKNLVELLGGKLWVESTEDVGTIFYFTLPYKKISKTKKIKKSRKKKADYNWNDKTILIAEDEKLNYTYLAEVLERTGATIIWAKTGSQVVNLYRKHKKKINVILMDIKMPKLSGYEAMKIIRKADTDIPMIVQTAHVISGEKDKSFEAGCDEYLTKPIKYDKLLTTIQKYISYEPDNKDGRK